MSYPVGGAPDGAWQLGSGFGQGIHQDDVAGIVTSEAAASFTAGAVNFKSTYNDRIDSNYAIATAAQGSADSAVTTAEAAANTAADANSTAADANIRASYWEAECVVSSAAVVLGVNELLIGLCQNVPGGMIRTITDMHVALLSQPAGMAFQLVKWDSTGTTSSVLGTYTLAANVTRASWNTLGLSVLNKERVYWNITSITGSTAPVVFQVLLFGTLET